MAREIPVRNPRTGENDYAIRAPDEAELAEIAAAMRAAQPAWQALGAAGRAEILNKWAEALLAEPDAVLDANAHLGRLVRPGFVLAAGVDRLGDVERYVAGVAHRLDHLAGAIERDRQRMAEVVPLEDRYAAYVDALPAGGATPELLELARRLEELRVSVFAQPIGADGPVSPKRVARALTALGA